MKQYQCLSHVIPWQVAADDDYCIHSLPPWTILSLRSGPTNLHFTVSHHMKNQFCWFCDSGGGLMSGQTQNLHCCCWASLWLPPYGNMGFPKPMFLYPLCNPKIDPFLCHLCHCDSWSHVISNAFYDFLSKILLCNCVINFFSICYWFLALLFHFISAFVFLLLWVFESWR